MRPSSLANNIDADKAIPLDVLEPIAVVGLATRFPQEAQTTEALWEVLLQARSTWSPIPKERFNSEAFYHPDPEHGGTVGSTLFSYNRGSNLVILITGFASFSSMCKVVIISRKTRFTLTALFSISPGMSFSRWTPSSDW